MTTPNGYDPSAPTGRVSVEGEAAEGITVSDGLHVTKTGSNGRFELPGHGPFVMITSPTGYTADRWYAPAGSANLDFELLTAEQQVPFSFAQISDLHLALGDRSFGDGFGDATFWPSEAGWHERVVTTPEIAMQMFDEVSSHRVGFIVSTGDQTNAGKEEEFEAYVDCVERLRVPTVSIPGNHDHAQALSETTPLMPYERHLGPRWFSFDFAGVHFVAIDWLTHLFGFDTEVQEKWLTNDLGLIEPHTPVIFLTHDQMDSSFYEGLPVVPVASFSGHWHTTRVVEHRGTVHYNTGAACFGGLDYSPAHYRVVTWDGDRLSVETVARAPAHLAGATFRPIGPVTPKRATMEALWTVSLAGAAHRAAPLIQDGLVMAASKSEDIPGGAVQAFDLWSGEEAWRVDLDSGVKSSPISIGGRTIAISVSGETVCIDEANGEEVWRTKIDDPLRPWTYLRPVSDGHRIFVGDVARFVALDNESGEVV